MEGGNKQIINARTDAMTTARVEYRVNENPTTTQPSARSVYDHAHPSKSIDQVEEGIETNYRRKKDKNGKKKKLKGRKFFFKRGIKGKNPANCFVR